MAYNAFFPTEILNPKFVPLLMVEDLAIMLNPNNPHDNAPEGVPNSKSCFVILLDALPKHVIFPVKFMERVLPGATKLKKDL